MDFQKVTFDEELDEMESDDLRDLVRQFREAQEDNLAEFQQASEEIDDLEGRVGEVQEFDSELTEELAEVSPLSEEEAAEFSISRKRDLLADFAEEDEEPEDEEPEEDEEDEDPEDDQEFSDFGTRGETHDEEEAQKNFAEQYLGDIQGLEL